MGSATPHLAYAVVWSGQAYVSASPLSFREDRPPFLSFGPPMLLVEQGYIVGPAHFDREIEKKLAITQLIAYSFRSIFYIILLALLPFALSLKFAENMGLLKSVWKFFATFCNQCSDVTTKFSARNASVILGVFVLNTVYYSCFRLKTMRTQTVSLPFSGMDGAAKFLLKNPDFNLGIFAWSQKSVLTKSELMAEFLKQKGRLFRIGGMTEGVKRICSGEKLIYLATNDYFDRSLCEMFQIMDPLFGIYPNSFALAKNSSLLPLMKNLLGKIYSPEQLEKRIYSKYLGRAHNSLPKMPRKRLALEQIRPAFTFWAASLLGSVIAFISEFVKIKHTVYGLDGITRCQGFQL